MSKLADILKDIEDNNKTIAIETLLDDEPYLKTRSAWQNAINDARETNVKLMDSYRKEALANSIVMFVYGSTDKVETFLSLARDEANVFMIRADGMYRDIATKLEEGIGPHRLLVTGQIMDLVGYVVQYASKYGLMAFNKITVESDLHVPTYEDTVAVVRDKVRQNNGDEFTNLYVARAFSDMLLNSGYKGNVVPVIVVVHDEEEAMRLSPLFSKNGGIHDLSDATVDKKYVLDVFQEAMKSSKKRKNSQ